MARNIITEITSIRDKLVEGVCGQRDVWVATLNVAIAQMTTLPDKVAAIIDERGGLAGTGRYGPFIDNAVIAQELKETFRQSPNWNTKLNAAQREALDLIAMKISRILSGDPNYQDNYDDAEGYLRLAKHDWQKDVS